MMYEVKDATGDIVSSHKTQDEAVSRAAEIDGATVVAHETSGTYQSWMQVWPTRGECYTN